VNLLLGSMRAPLERWSARALSPGLAAGPGPRDARDVYELEIAREPAGDALADGPFRRAARAILRYDIFEPSTLTGCLERTPLRVGDTVGARYHLAPGLDLFFASRVSAVFDELVAERSLRRAGFTYRTLEGHPELGEETFSVEKDTRSGAVVVALRAWSRPGLWITRAGWFLGRRLQVAASRGALRHLARAAE